MVRVGRRSLVREIRKIDRARYRRSSSPTAVDMLPALASPDIPDRVGRRSRRIFISAGQSGDRRETPSVVSRFEGISCRPCAKWRKITPDSDGSQFEPHVRTLTVCKYALVMIDFGVDTGIEWGT